MQALPLIATGFQIFGNLKASKDAKKVGDYNARLQEMEAARIRKSSDLEEYQAMKNLEQRIGLQRAQYAGSGISVSTGSPLDVISDTMKKGLLDIRINRYNNESYAIAKEQGAQVTRYEAKKASQAYKYKAGIAAIKGGMALDPGKLFEKPEESTQASYG